MYVQLCDRCRRKTNNKPAFLMPVSKDDGYYQVGGVWFGDPIILCNNCLFEFNEFRCKHENFNLRFVEEDNFDGKEKIKI